MNQFGDFIRDKRRGRGITLRTFSRLCRMDAANFSRLERGVIKPPKDITYIAMALRISPESDEYAKLALYADVGRGEVPKDIMDEVEFVKLLPTIWCSMREAKACHNLEGLPELLRKALR